MNELKRFANHRVIVLSGGAAALVFAAQVASCGGDDSGGGSTDGGADVVADQTTDGSPIDSGDGAVDAGSDSPNDSQADSRGDSGDASIDAPTLGQFNLVVAQSFCQRLEQCCLATSASWDQNKCVTLYSNTAFAGVFGVAHAARYVDGGHLSYDPALASQCLAQLSAIPCGLVSAAVLNADQSLCLSAIAGTIDAGATGCASSYECVSATFCALADGGPGTCTALVGDGGACTAEDQCGYLANGPPALYCNSTSHTCQPRVDVDAGCVDNSVCLTNHCQVIQGRAQCVDQGVFSDPGVPNGSCDFFTIHDAGDGG